MTKILVIAWQSLRGFARDRVFHSALIFSVLFVLFAFLLSSLSALETRKVLLDFGLSAISLLGVILALFLGVTVIGKEIEQRTIYTILSKPVNRTQYVLGKFLGAAATMVLVHALNGFTLLCLLWNLGEGVPPALFEANYLMVLESILVLGVSMLFSLYFSTLFLAASLAGAMFLVGRSSYGLHLMQEKSPSAAVKWIARVLFDLLPSLDRFNIRELVAYGKPYPEGMVGVSSLYFLAYIAFLLALSVVVIRRKDFI